MSSKNNPSFEQQLFKAADKLRKNIDAAEYKYVVLGLVFIKYISETFNELYEKLEADAYSDPEDRDEYLAENVFFVPQVARWSHIHNSAKLPSVGEIIDEAMEAIEKEIGPIEILVNNAGIHNKKPSIEVTDAEFHMVMDTNINSVFALTRTVLKYMMPRGKGSVISISSMAALFGITQVVAYSSAKTALLGMTRSLASEYSHTGVRFNAIAPGFIETKMFLDIMEKDPMRKEKILSRTPARRFGTTEDVAYAAVYLASDVSNFITGICLPVDGGNSIGF